MKTARALLLVHPSMQSVVLKERVNIMLTPQFYTLKRETLPVKYAYQAKKIAPSLFEGLLEEGGSYAYMVFKEKEQWVFIAYDLHHIEKFLSSKGIEPSMVSKIFFVQQAVDKFSAPVALGEREALVVLDGNMVVVPRAALEEEVLSVSRLDKHFTPQKGVSLQGGSDSFLTRKQSYMLAGVLLLFALLFIVEGIRYESKKEEKELQELYDAYPALQSSYTRDGVLEKYRNLDIKERKKRERIKEISNLIFKGVTLTKLVITEQKYQADFTCVSAAVSKKLEDLAKKAKFKIKKAKNSHNITIEGVL